MTALTKLIKGALVAGATTCALYLTLNLNERGLNKDYLPISATGGLICGITYLIKGKDD